MPAKNIITYSRLLTMENGKHIKVLTLQFDAEITAWEISLFRGAVLASIGKDVDILFHNHVEDDGFRYSYPLIQYKRFRGKAAIVCVEEGVDSIGQFLVAQDSTFVLGDRTIKLEMQSVRPQNILVQTWQSDFFYQLQHWLPLNSKNLKVYQETESLTARIALLEGILRGNLLSMCKGLGIYLTEELKVSITRLSEPRLVKVKGIKALSFDVDFRSNLSIPDGVGIGKNASIGFGTVRNRTKENKKQDHNESNNE